MFRQLEHALNALRSGEEFVLATLVESEGSAPGRAGFRMIVYRDRIEGTIGGGALEHAMVARARQMLGKKSDPQLIAINLADLKMACGGRVTVFLEPFALKTPLWIFGAGHIARALAPIMAPLPFRTTVVDNRPGFAVQDAFPEGTALITGEYKEVLAEVPSEAYAVIVTHGHVHDQEILLSLAARDPGLPYIGMIGSRRKIEITRDLLEKQGIGWTNIYAPIGLNIGGESVGEIAVAVAAEVLGVFHRKVGLPHCRTARVSTAGPDGPPQG